MPDPSDTAMHVMTVAGGILGGAFVRDIIAWLRGSRKDKAETDKLLSDTLDTHIKTLLGGYDMRVKDLTDEVHTLRGEVVNLRQALDASRVEMRSSSCILRGGCEAFSPIET